MSHCVACDRLLTDKEAKRKHRVTKEEIGLCDHCLLEVEKVQHIPTDGSLDYSDEPELDELDLDIGFSRNFNYPEEE